jgi:hypothetical protein
MTDYHNLNTPEEGAADWHLPLNENFQTIDKKIEIRDEASARSDYPPKAGAKYFATDTGAQWIGDGDEWHRLASTGESPEFDSITHRDPSGAVLKRRCLYAASSSERDGIPAPDEYDFYHIRLISAGADSRISFNDPPGDTLARRELIDSNDIPINADLEQVPTVAPFEIYVIEREDKTDLNKVRVLGTVSNSLEFSNDPINRIYVEGQIAEAWGIKREER